MVQQFEKEYEMKNTLEENITEQEAENLWSEKEIAITKINRKFEKRIRCTNIVVNLALLVAIVVLIVGLSIETFPVTEKISNSLSLFSFGMTFLSFFHARLMNHLIAGFKQNVEDMSRLIRAVNEYNQNKY